jgi:hypothetical protein
MVPAVNQVYSKARRVGVTEHSVHPISNSLHDWPAKTRAPSKAAWGHIAALGTLQLSRGLTYLLRW